MGPEAMTIPTTTRDSRHCIPNANQESNGTIKSKKTSLQYLSTHPMLSFLTGKNPSGSILVKM